MKSVYQVIKQSLTQSMLMLNVSFIHQSNSFFSYLALSLSHAHNSKQKPATQV